MPQRDATLIGAPCWIDLFTSDLQRSRAFYGQLFGWTDQETGEEFGGYVNFLRDGQPVAGCMGNDQPGVPDTWSVYLTTDDAQTTADAAVASGGQVLVPAMEVKDLGSMALVADVGGAAIGAWQPGLHHGFAVLGEPAAPSWFELLTRDYDASVQFYRDVFKWETYVNSDTPDFRYTSLGQGEAQAAGIMDAASFLPDGVPAAWSVYFGVDDADVALATVVDLGGSVVRPAEDTPYGRLAQVADPTGAVFKVVAG